ncbi:MAG: Rieske (2Fe-2S) protein [Pedobacter sp.]|nr:MAG: Rieske (2Fe-2S) protein [Pedobacter sp.]
MKSFLPALFFLIMFAGCAKSDDLLPNLPVNFSAPLTDPRLSRLTTPGGAVTINGQGIAGLVIYRKPDGGYMAYDRCSTVNPEMKCAVDLDDPALTVTDPCSGAKFSLIDGSPVKAPAVQSLRQYNVSIAGNTLMINN